jgi:acyl-CoA thioesterase-1
MILRSLFFATFIFTSLSLAQSSPTGELRIAILGDSLTEGYGVAADAAFPAVAEKILREKNPQVRIINSGISGSTTASGLPRLKWLMKSKPQIVVIALGSNDGLRGMKTEETEKNLSQVIEALQKEKVKVAIVGFQMPPNYGKDYTEKFKAVFPRLAKKYHLAYYPFLLEGVAADKDLNQADMIHPNEKGHKKIGVSFAEFLRKLL